MVYAHCLVMGMPRLILAPQGIFFTQYFRDRRDEVTEPAMCWRPAMSAACHLRRRRIRASRSSIACCRQCIEAGSVEDPCTQCIFHIRGRSGTWCRAKKN